MHITKKEFKILSKNLGRLVEAGSIECEEQAKIEDNLEILPFNWKKLARYSFLTAIICGVISIGAVIADDLLREILEKLFDLPDGVKSASLFIISGFAFWGASERKNNYPGKVYSNEVINFIGVLLIAGGIAFLGKSIDTGSGHFSLLILLASILYGLIGYAVNSTLIWVFGLLSLGGWLGAETGYVSGWGAYYLGMSYPLRFVLFGLALILAASIVRRKDNLNSIVYQPTRVIGLLYLMISLWILSIFGNYWGYDDWERATQLELVFWSLLFGIAACTSAYFGLKMDDGTCRGFGITFFFINLYTKFFEHFWEGTHKAIFFAILAISFWALGSKAEAIWELTTFRRKLNPGKIAERETRE